jgi:hypothetical protein
VPLKAELLELFGADYYQKSPYLARKEALVQALPMELSEKDRVYEGSNSLILHLPAVESFSGIGCHQHFAEYF